MCDYSLNNLSNIFSTVIELRNIRYDLSIDAKGDFRNTALMWAIRSKRRLGYDITGGGVFLTDIPKFPLEKNNLLDVRLNLLEHLGASTSDKRTSLTVRPENINWVRRFYKDNSLSDFETVSIHPGSSRKEKLWEPKRFAKIISYLNNKGFVPLVIEGPDESEIVDQIADSSISNFIRVKTGLGNVVALIKSCRLLICLDSAAIHIAGAVGTPCLALYGPYWPELTKPFQNNIRILFEGDMNCRPCEYGNCAYPENSCMQRISVKLVESALARILSQSK